MGCHPIGFHMYSFCSGTGVLYDPKLLGHVCDICIGLFGFVIGNAFGCARMFGVPHAYGVCAGTFCCTSLFTGVTFITGFGSAFIMSVTCSRVGALYGQYLGCVC